MTARDAEQLRHGTDVFVVLPPEPGVPARLAAALVEGRALFLIKTAPFITLILQTGQRVTVSADRVYSDVRSALAAACRVATQGA
jgi:hypothetical protein